MKIDEVRCRIDEMRERGAERAEVTVASLVAELEASRKLAAKLGQTGASATSRQIIGKSPQEIGTPPNRDMHDRYGRGFVDESCHVEPLQSSSSDVHSTPLFASA
jgi:hypothetical protein